MDGSRSDSRRRILWQDQQAGSWRHIDCGINDKNITRSRLYLSYLSIYGHYQGRQLCEQRVTDGKRGVVAAVGWKFTVDFPERWSLDRRRAFDAPQQGAKKLSRNNVALDCFIHACTHWTVAVLSVVSWSHEKLQINWLYLYYLYLNKSLTRRNYAVKVVRASRNLHGVEMALQC